MQKKSDLNLILPEELTKFFIFHVLCHKAPFLDQPPVTLTKTTRDTIDKSSLLLILSVQDESKNLMIENKWR